TVCAADQPGTSGYPAERSSRRSANETGSLASQCTPLSCVLGQRTLANTSSDPCLSAGYGPWFPASAAALRSASSAGSDASGAIVSSGGSGDTSGCWI